MEHLTPEMIAEELPGARLDSWVQANLMTVPPLFAYTKMGGPSIDYFPQGHQERIAISDRVMAEEVPNYSTDIAAAWKVVETINSRGWPFCIQLTADGRVVAESSSMECNSSDFFNDGRFYTTVPEAICKAALLVLSREYA
jgi:Phage ABA sandwich domain